MENKYHEQNGCAWFFSICFGNDRRPLLGSSYNKHKSQGLMGINIVEINNALNKTLKHVNTFPCILGHLWQVLLNITVRLIEIIWKHTY